MNLLIFRMFNLEFVYTPRAEYIKNYYKLKHEIILWEKFFITFSMKMMKWENTNHLKINYIIGMCFWLSAFNNRTLENILITIIKVNFLQIINMLQEVLSAWKTASSLKALTELAKNNMLAF